MNLKMAKQSNYRTIVSYYVRNDIKLSKPHIAKEHGRWMAWIEVTPCAKNTNAMCFVQKLNDRGDQNAA